MTTKKIPLDKIVQTHLLPQREKIEAIKQTIKKDGNINLILPIECNYIDGKYFIVDGSKRYLAVKELGYEFIWGGY